MKTRFARRWVVCLPLLMPCFVAATANLVHYNARNFDDRLSAPLSSVENGRSEMGTEAFEALMSTSSASGDLSDSLFLGDSFETHSLLPHLQRVLQQRSDSNATTPSPSAVCASVNEALKNVMNCTCERYDKTDVSISCTALNARCNSDGTWCAMTNINYIVDRDAQARSMLSCTNVTTRQAGDPPLNTCVQLIPAVNGDFANLSQCYALLNDEACSCTTTPACLTNSTVTSSSDAVTHIGINCCQVQDGAVASCQSVVQNGVVLVFYDAVTDGQCPESSAMGMFGLGGCMGRWRAAMWVGAWCAMLLGSAF